MPSMSQPVSTRPESLPRPALMAGLLLAVLAPILLMLKPEQWTSGFSVMQRLLLNESILWGLAGTLLLLVRLGERQPLSSLGLRTPTLGTFGWAVVGFVALMLMYPLVQLLLKALGLGVSQTQSFNLKELPVAAIVILALRAGVVEELLFRGYLIERLNWFTGKLWLAASLSLLLFVVVHLKSWSLGHLIYVSSGGVALTALYVWRRDLICNMLAHFLVDAIGLLAIKFMPAA